MYQNYIKYNTKTASKSIQTCSPLLCYRKANRTNSCGNAIANSQSLFKTEADFSNFEKSLTKQLLEVALNLLRGNDLI